MAELLHAPVGEMFAFPGGKELEPVLDDSGNVEALIVRSRDAIRGSVEVSAVPVGNGVFRLSVVLSNLTLSLIHIFPESPRPWQGIRAWGFAS